MIDVPGDMSSVVRRWYPEGLDIVADARRVVPSGVYVTGTSGSGVTAVEREVGCRSAVSEDVASAAVVVFVVDAAAPIGRRGLAELMPALDSTTVAVVVNKIDAHREWRDVTRSIAASISEYAPRAVDVSVWPVSAALAERARNAAVPQARAALYEESGFAALDAYLAGALAEPAGLLRARKYDAAVHSAASGARRAIVERAREITGTGSTVGLRAERATLVERRDRERHDRTTALRTRLQLLRAEVNHDIGEESRAFVTASRESVSSASRSELRHLPTHLTEQLNEAGRRVDTHVTGKIQSIADDLDMSAELPTEATVFVVEPPKPRRRTVEDKIVIVVGASAGVGLGRILVSPLSMLPALEVAVVPASLILGALTAWWLVRSRAATADRTHLRTWAADAAASAKSAWEQAALARMLAAESVFVPASNQSIGTATLATESELERVETDLRAAADRRAAVLSACDRDLAVLDRGVEKFDAKSMEPALAPSRPKD
ncbi:hypothetical protein [Rhodococcoides kyotonense]|uniref:Dynamin family protein n=1 Tax=Rhodococcoides kyotonense TaxID=398843 RepID=A0A239JBN1_9NOCA|nr:hypothetical protein [Rhodococcus kyotonensis]SNT03260.1 hypothetical protein SAMN05421642_108146 [Rhodococcus kyotonensis]